MMSELQSMFFSPLADHIIKFIELKQACGFKYHQATKMLRRLDRYFVDKGLSRIRLTENLIEPWLAKRSYETLSTQSGRVTLYSNFARYLLGIGVKAYLPPGNFMARRKSTYVPYIFSTDQVLQLFKAADGLTYCRTTYLHLAAFPIILRLLYSSGLRVGEAIRFQWRDFDVSATTLTVRDGKMGKDRFIPLSSQMSKIMRQYAKEHTGQSPDDPIFPGYRGKMLHRNTIYRLFRIALFNAGIPHRGRGKGPRLHDLRHTFAVHNLEKWLKGKKDLNVLLSVLADYLGHDSLDETQHYLQLMPSIYPEIVSRMEKSVGRKIRRWDNETN